MSNGPLKNCALGICCPPGSPAQVAALAQWMEEQMGDASLAGEGLYHRLAKTMISAGMIGMPLPHFFEWVHLATLPPGGAASPNAGPEGA